MSNDPRMDGPWTGGAEDAWDDNMDLLAEAGRNDDE
jgi:hypothetical protein